MPEPTPQPDVEVEEEVVDTQPSPSGAAGTGEAAAPAPEPEHEAPAPDPVADAEARAQEYLELAQRKQAEFENFRKRMSAQSASSEARGVSRVAKELLAPLDHLGLAIEHADDASREPLEALRREFLGALGRAGVEAFAPLGEVFDPSQHEAMAQAPFEDREPGTVAEVYQAGYRLGESIIRPARVVVAQ